MADTEGFVADTGVGMADTEGFVVDPEGFVA